jgi:hypothetical protein
MTSALIVLALLGICTALCFIQAARIQRRWAVDGILRDRLKYGAMRLWVIAGIAFGVATFGLLMAMVNPPPASFGRL